MIYLANIQIKKGGIIIPINDFIINILNIEKDKIDNCDVKTMDGTITYEVTLKREKTYCPLCYDEMISYGHKIRKIKHSNIRGFKGIIIHRANRYLCKYCNKTITERNPFTFNGFNVSYSTIVEVMKHLKNLNYNLKMISEELNISKTQINNYIDSYIVIPKLKLPEWIGIDEIHSKSLSYKNASYLCVITDNENRCLFDILGSRSKNHLSNYLSAIKKEERENVKYVTIDMYEVYKDVAKKSFPNCIIAVDPFHYVKHLCDGFERLRLNLMKQCEYKSPAYYLLKKWHWLLESNDVNLDNEAKYNSVFNTKLNHRDIFNMIVDNFPLLYDAYLLKEEFRDLVKHSSYEEAKSKYDDIYKAFKDSNIKEYQDFINILENWKDEILNSFIVPYDKHKLSNAYAENINGKIGTYIRVSNGMTNFKRFRKRILYALNTKVFYSISNILESLKREGSKRGPYNKNKE